MFQLGLQENLGRGLMEIRIKGIGGRLAAIPYILIGLTIPLLPFFWVSSGRPRYGEIAGFMIIALIMASAQVRNLWIRFFGYYVAVWLIVSKLFLMFSFSQEFATIVIITMQESTYIMCGLIVIIFVTETDIKLENWICVSAIIQSLIAIPQHFGVFPFMELLSYAGLNIVNPVPGAIGTLENTGFLAAYIAISLPFFFRRRWCWFVPVIVVQLIPLKASTAVIGAVIGVAVFWNAWWVIAVLSIVALGYVWYDNLFTTGLDNRFAFWKMCISNVKNPWYGHGVGAQWGVRAYLHNEYLQVFWEFGLIGLGLVVGYIATVYRRDRMLFAALCIAIVNCVGNYPMHLPPSGYLIVVIIGLIERKKRKEV